MCCNCVRCLDVTKSTSLSDAEKIDALEECLTCYSGLSTILSSAIYRDVIRSVVEYGLKNIRWLDEDQKYSVIELFDQLMHTQSKRKLAEAIGKSVYYVDKKIKIIRYIIKTNIVTIVEDMREAANEQT